MCGFNVNVENKHIPCYFTDYKEVFNLFDKDGDGTITLEELGIVMQSLGRNPNEDDLRSVMSTIDTDGE